MADIVWHHRETRWQTEKTNLGLNHCATSRLYIKSRKRAFISGIIRSPQTKYTKALAQRAFSYVVIFLHRERIGGPEQEVPRNVETELIVAKQRNGPVGAMKIAYIPEYTKFENFNRGTESG
jgi:DnaB-like helicase C terminal domain